MRRFPPPGRCGCADDAGYWGRATTTAGGRCRAAGGHRPGMHARGVGIRGLRIHPYDGSAARCLRVVPDLSGSPRLPPPVPTRRHAVVVAGSLVTEWLLFGAPEGFGVFILPIVAGYSVAAHADRRRALVGLAALAITAVLWPLLDPADTTMAARIGAIGWMTPVLVAWLVGAYLREIRGHASPGGSRAGRSRCCRSGRRAGSHREGAPRHRGTQRQRHGCAGRGGR